MNQKKKTPETQINKQIHYATIYHGVRSLASKYLNMFNVTNHQRQEK